MVNYYVYIGFLFVEMIVSGSIAFYMISLLFSSIKGAPYVPTRMKEIRHFLHEAGLKKGQVFIELGSGDGRVTRTAAKEYSVKGIGIDINPYLILNSRLQAKIQRLNNVRFLRRNILDYSLGEADVVYMFLMPKFITRIIPKLETELKSGTLVISHGFKIPGWEKKLKKTISHNPFPTYFYEK